MSSFAPSPSTEDAGAVESARWLAPAGLTAAILLGLALQDSNGFLTPIALRLAVIGFVLVVLATVTPRPVRFARLDAGLVPLLGTAGLALHLIQLYAAFPGIYLQLEPGGLAPFHWGLAILAAVGGSLMWDSPRWARLLQIGVLVATHAALGIWVLQRSPDPTIDVHMFHRYAIAAFRQGVDPYAITFPDIYNNAANYGDGVLLNGRLQFGFPYFPLSLLLSMPAQLLTKDPRYSQLVAIELAALLMAFARRGGVGVVAAVLYLTTPRIFFVLEQSWTEPFLVLGVAAVVFAACRQSRLVPWLFGAFVALKQYLVFALPAAVLLASKSFDRREAAIFLTKGALLGAIVTLPFVLWDPEAFWRSVVTLQIRQPFRPDALSVLSWWAGQGHEQPSSLIAFIVAGIASAVGLWRLPHTPAGFATAIGLTFFAFFLFNKQAFCNYYFFVVGTLYVSVAAWHPQAIE